MARRAHVVRRAERTSERDFPAEPTLPRGAPCDGFALVLRAGAPPPDLRAMRDQIAGLWRGALDPSQGEELLFARFVERAVLPATLAPAALPLSIAGQGTLASFRETASPPEEPSIQTPARRIELWWGGRRHRLAIEALTALPIETLWDMPRVRLHPPIRPPSVAVSTPRKDANALSPVTRAGPVVVADKGADLAGQIDRDMEALAGRTTLRAIFNQFLGRGEGGPGTRPPPGPGVLENLKGWLRWHTPLGDPMRRSFAERLKLVEKMIASGDVDGALKLALAVGAADRARQAARLASAPPAMRGGLDFNIAAMVFSVPLSFEAHQSLHTRYLALAERLELDGDFRRAAFVHSQLLGDHRRAVQVLEKGELFKEAAKLALDAKLEPILAIRMLFKAGDLTAALALARRSDSFEELAELSRGGDTKFHAFVVKAWTDALLATDQPLRAIQITDRLADTPQVPAALLAARRGWLGQAFAQQEADSPSAELVVRALLTAAWNSEDLQPSGLDDFPHGSPALGGAVPAQALNALRRLLLGEAEGSPEGLIDILAGLARLALPKTIEQAAFWQGPAPLLVEALARGLIETASTRLGSAELGALQQLLNQADLPVLATDIRKLKKLHRVAEAPMVWTLPPPVVVTPKALRACLLAGGGLLVWRDGGMLQLLDRHGRLLWQRAISDVVGLVAVGSSPSVLILQAQADGAVLLTRFATNDRTFHPIGRLKLLAHNAVTTESQWLVQIGGEIGALDLEKLCAPSPAVEFLWSSALTERVRTIAFAHFPAGASWLTRDVSSGRFGLLEEWTMSPAGVLSNRLVLPDGAAAPLDWYWTPALLGRAGPGTASMQRMPWDMTNERRALTIAAQRGDNGVEETDSFQPVDLGRPYMVFGAVEPDDPTYGTLSLFDLGAKPPKFTFAFGAGTTLRCLARAPAPAGQRSDLRQPPRLCLFADEAGRIFLLDLVTRNVLTL